MVVIRLTRLGTKHRPFYRIVATDKRRPRESRYIDLLGYYNPMLETADVKVDLDKYQEWIAKGAVPSPTVKSLVKKVKSEKSDN
jgi:small subunit ribosomal protein S16